MYSLKTNCALGELRHQCAASQSSISDDTSVNSRPLPANTLPQIQESLRMWAGSLTTSTCFSFNSCIRPRVLTASSQDEPEPRSKSNALCGMPSPTRYCDCQAR